MFFGMKLTIITINLNNTNGLQKTISSVLAQDASDFECIIIDGDSSDGSKDVILHISHTNINIKAYSEKDSGVYNAMNKGIQLAQGEYVQFLNSGDWLVDENVVSKMLNELKRLNHPDILVGNKIMVRPDGKMKKDININLPVSVYTFYRGTIDHTSTYIRRSLFDEYGYYDESFKIVSDWKWYLQAAGLGKAKVAFTDLYVSFFDTTGISSTNKDLELKERRQVLEDLLPVNVLVDYDRFSFDIVQMERLKRYPLIYKIVWFVERLLFDLPAISCSHFGTLVENWRTSMTATAQVAQTFWSINENV